MVALFIAELQFFLGVTVCFNFLLKFFFKFSTGRCFRDLNI